MVGPRDPDPLKLLLGPKKYPLWRFPIENISWAQVALLGVETARAGDKNGTDHANATDCWSPWEGDLYPPASEPAAVAGGGE